MKIVYVFIFLICWTCFEQWIDSWYGRAVVWFVWTVMHDKYATKEVYYICLYNVSLRISLLLKSIVFVVPLMHSRILFCNYKRFFFSTDQMNTYTHHNHPLNIKMLCNSFMSFLSSLNTSRCLHVLSIYIWHPWHMELLCIQQNTINTERDAQSLLQSNNGIMLNEDNEKCLRTCRQRE